jgi:type II secretory pathway component GspD/PulD (secretin)
MFLEQRWTVVVTGVLLLGLCEAALHAQESVTVEVGPNGPVIMRGGVPQPMPPGAARMMPGGGPPGGPMSPPTRPGDAPVDPSKAGEGEKPSDEKKPDSDKPEKKEEGKDAKKEGDDKKPKEGEGPTRRPTEPPEPPDPEVLKIRPDDEGKVSFNFKGHSWPSVLEWIADISGMSLDWQELPEGYLNLITQKKYDVAEARDLINRHLLARGYTMLFQDEVISVFKIDSINSGMVPRVEPEELADRQPYEFVKVSFPLDWLLATETAEELKPMCSSNGKLTPLQATNRLEAMDAVLNLRQVYEVLMQEQSDSGQDRLVREFVLKHTSAREVVEHLNKLLGIESKSAAPKMPMDPQQMEAMRRQAQMEAEMAKNTQGKGPAPAKQKAEIYLLANERKNSVVVNAPPDKMAVIAQAVEILDVSTVPEMSIIENINRIQVYRLENAEPAAVVKMIQDMGSLDHTSHLEVDKENNAIIASATLVDHVTIRTLVDRLDRGGRQSLILPLKNLRAEMVVKQINFLMGGAENANQDTQDNSNRGYNPFDPFGRSFSRPRSSQSPGHEDKFRVSADVKNNALILWCNEFELRKVEGLLEQLEAMPDSGDGVFEVHVYRLNTLDPEPLVSTLEDMDALGVHASLKADKESKSIVAYATAPDHKKIQDLIDRLDASGRKFEVVQLRRLQADYVAGTIEFMMDAGEKEQQNTSRYYWDYYPRNRGGEQDDKSGFKIDADVENNRLLLLANEAEMAEVMNLLVKLGEIPAEGGDPSTVRVIDSLPGPELEKLLRQIEKAWPAVAPNPLLLPGKDNEAKEKQAEPTGGPEKKDLRPSTAGNVPPSPRFRFAQHEASAEEPAAEPPPVQEQAEPLGEKTEADAPALNPLKTAAAKTPVSITVGADGRLVIASEDTQALDRLEELLANLAPNRPDYEIFQLKYGWAYSVALTLEDIFEDKKEDKSSRGRSFFYYDYYGYNNNNNDKSEKLRLSQRRPLKFISDSQSNSILVQNADPGQLKVIAELIEFYDQPEPSDSQSIRKTEIVAVKYSKASVIAETVKEVYRDLLSANDKALANNQQKNMPERSYTYVYDSSGSDEERKTPSFKGMLSLGVDDLSNTLIVSAPAYFITDVLQVIETLDRAAEPTTETVEVISLDKGVSAPELQKTLMKILQQRSGGKPKENDKPPQPGWPGPGPGGPGPR